MKKRISQLRPGVVKALVILAVVFTGTAGRMSAAPMDSAAAAGQGGESRLGAPVVLRADPRVSRHRTPPPMGAVSVMRVQTAEIAINYLPEGSFDPDGKRCYTWPDDARTAFRYAADIWETLIESSVVIGIDACWAELDGTYLGYSIAYIDRNFDGAPEPHTWYALALANALNERDRNRNKPEMYLTYNKNLDDTNEWYFGTGDSTPGDQYDFASVVLHEIAHGLGFSGSMSVSSGKGSWGVEGDPYSYDHFTQDWMGNSLIDTAVYPNPSIALGDALTSEQVWFSGPNADAANGGERVRLHAPSTWQEGSSYTHLHDDFNETENALMTYSLKKGESNHSPGPVSMGILQDVGWAIEEGPTVDSIEPASGERGGAISVVIEGSHFQDGAAVELVRSGDRIAGTNVTVESVSRITCGFDLTDEAPGPWDVVVTNPSGQRGVLSEGFLIIAPDVSITKSVAGSGGDTFAPGDALTYTLDIANEGDAPASQITVVDVLPEEILNPIYDSTLTITRTGTISYTWQVEELGPGDSGAINVYGQIDASLGSDFSIRNEAAVDDPQDVTPSNNTSSVTILGSIRILLPLVMKN
ncbi:MAG: hypothetical protein ACOC7Y_01685 [Chloroflexota bacterium]